MHKIRDLLDSGKVCAISLAMGSLPHPDPIPSALTWLTSGKGFPHHYRFIYLFITFSVVNVLCGMGTEQKWRSDGAVISPGWRRIRIVTDSLQGLRNCKGSGQRRLTFLPLCKSALLTSLISASSLLRSNCSLKKLIILFFSPKTLSDISNVLFTWIKCYSRNIPMCHDC